MDGKSPTAKDERHNSTKLSFWNWKVFGGQNEKKASSSVVRKVSFENNCDSWWNLEAGMGKKL